MTDTDLLAAPLKRCTKCGEEKPATTEYFHKNASGRLGVNNVCKLCVNRKPPRAETAPGRKICTSCKEEKPATSDFFTRNKCTPDGLEYKCRSCRAAWKAVYKQKPEVRERENARMRERRSCPLEKQRIRERQKELRSDPLEKQRIREYNKRRLQDPDFIAARKEYDARRKANPSVKQRMKELSALRRSDPLLRQRDRERDVKRDYGLEPNEYIKFINDRGNRCEICLRSPEEAGQEYLCIDHDHDTGENRGLLCHDCNLMIGNAEEDIGRLDRGAAYVEFHNMLKAAR